MIIYSFDGTFEGFLCCIYESYYGKKLPDKIFIEDDIVQNLIDEIIEIPTDEEKSDKVYKSLRDKFTYSSFQKIFYVFLSNDNDSYTKLYKFIRLGFKLGRDVDMHLHNSIVMDIEKISHRVTLEAHRFLGFVRFREFAPGAFYSPIEPDHNILPMIAAHFTKRFSNQNFIIHDVKRGLALIYNKKDYVISSLSKKEEKTLKNTEDIGMYEELWKSYFSSAAIDERNNSTRQKQSMPKRYWSNLTEMKGEV